MRHMDIEEEAWPIAGGFTISRGTKTEARTLTVILRENGFLGRGECVPYARYDETLESVRAQIDSVRHAIETGASRFDLLNLLPAGAARNAIDCALWDLEAKSTHRRVWELADLPPPGDIVTAEIDWEARGI